MIFLKKTINKLIHQYYNPRNKKGKFEGTYKSCRYIPGLSEKLEHSNIYDKNNYKLAFKTNNSLNNLFTKTKDRIEPEDRNNVVYRIQCEGNEREPCGKLYVGTTKNKLKTRLYGHKSDSKHNTGNMDQKTALATHCLKENHRANFNDVKILEQENHYRKRYTLEMLHIINVDEKERLNYKRDTDNCAHIYQTIIEKHKQKLDF